MTYEIALGDRSYSSWSMRIGLLVDRFSLPVTCRFGRLYSDDFQRLLADFAPARTVPALRLPSGIVIAESLAIAEELASRFPEAGLWPAGADARAVARALAAEMHAGFGALRSACPMNLRKRLAFRDFGRGAAENAVRIVELWRDARSRFGAGGPFLFGEFSAADAMYAPVVMRFESYSWPVDPDIRGYMDAVIGLPAFRAWLEAALKETWTVPSDEID